MQATQTLPTLLEIPENWPLVPVSGKRPYQKNWNNRQYDRLEILAELEGGKATGFGLKLGNGLLAIDVDGESAANLLRKFAGENGLQEFEQTVCWSSGRTGRQQYLFSVPEVSWCRLQKNLRIPTGEIDADGQEEGLEFRWLGSQSVLPPSIHPTTKKPYYWVRSPWQAQTIQAPEWLIALRENWHSEYVSDKEQDLVRFPARLFAHFGSQMNIWLLARRFDLSRRSPGGKPTGCGIGTFSLLGASRILNLSKRWVYDLLRAAKKSGLIRNFAKEGDWVKVYYTSFEKVVAIAGLEKIGPIAAIEIDDLSSLRILATEIEAQHQQKLSLYCKRQEEIEKLKAQGLDPGKIPSRIVQPGTLHTCDRPARVLVRGSRFLYCDSDFEFYGGKQEAIANNRGLSASTVSRHLSNSYRMEPSPIRQKRSGIPPIIKKQLLEKLPQLKGVPANLCTEDGLLFLHENWWKPHPNIYLLEHRLVSCRRRRGQIQAKTDKGKL